MEKIKEKVKSLGIEDSVKFLGQRNDANKLYQAFDVFCLPSLYEGLGMVLIEAQCSGLPSLCSTEVPSIAKVTENLFFEKLTESSKSWQIKIKIILENKKRNNYIEEIKKHGYDIKKEVEKLKNKYMQMIER